MGTVNVHALSIQKYKENDYTIERWKRDLDYIFDSYKEILDHNADKGEVMTVYFHPKKEQSTYTAFVSEYITTRTKKPCIIVFQSIIDIANFHKTALSRLLYLYTTDYVKAVYFTDYSLKYDAKHYIDFLIRVLRLEKDKIPVKDFKKTYSDELRREIIKLRTERGIIQPVAYADISEITGITNSSLRSICSGEGCSNKWGREIDPSERKELEELTKQEPENIINTVVLREIPLS